MFKRIQKAIKDIVKSNQKVIKGPVYRVTDFIKNEKGQYKAMIQVIGTKEFFKMNPEEILANDDLTATFHPFDIRLLTYLGYCGINTPQYKILAKKILANENIQLAIYDTKKDSVSVVDSDDIEISKTEMIKNLEPTDAYDLGFTHGRKSIMKEKELMKMQIGLK